MPDDKKRDILRPLTPPPGVRAQTAGSIQEAFEEEMTPVEGDTVTQIRKRSEQSAANSKGAYAAIREVRREMNDSINRVDGKVDSLTKTVGDMREDLGEVLGAVRTLAITAETSAKALAEGAIIRVKGAVEAEVHEKKAELDIDTHKEKAHVDEVKSKNEFTRKGLLQLLGIFATIATAVGTAYAAGSGCFSSSDKPAQTKAAEKPDASSPPSGK